MINRIILMGRMTDNPELKTTQSGNVVTSFSIAVDRRFKDNNGNYPTDFIRVVAWRKTAEFVCNYFSKGQMIAVDGSLQQRNYTDKDGNKHTAYEVLADNVSFCGSKTEKNADNAPSFNGDGFEEIADDGDYPF